MLFFIFDEESFSKMFLSMMIVLLLFLQKQKLATAIYLFGLGTLLSGLELKHMRTHDVHAGRSIARGSAFGGGLGFGSASASTFGASAVPASGAAPAATTGGERTGGFGASIRQSPKRIPTYLPCGWVLLQPPWSFGFDSQTRGTRENRRTLC